MGALCAHCAVCRGLGYTGAMTSLPPLTNTPAGVDPMLWDLLSHPTQNLNPKEKLEAIIHYDESYPGTIELLGTAGAIPLVDIPNDIKMTVWVAMTQQPRHLMEGVLSNFTDWRLDNLGAFVMSITLLNDNCRQAYCAFVTNSLQHERWSRDNRKSLGREVGPRVYQLINRHIRDGVGNIDEVLEDMTRLMEPGDVQETLENLLLDLCTKLPGRLDDQCKRTKRAAEVILSLAASGADPHMRIERLEEIIAEQCPGVACVNQLDQVVWLRHINGLGPEGGQGEQDPVVDALLDLGSEWRVVYNAPHSNEATRGTLAWHAAVKRGLLGDLSNTPGRRAKAVVGKL